MMDRLASASGIQILGFLNFCLNLLIIQRISKMIKVVYSKSPRLKGKKPNVNRIIFEMIG